MKSDNDRMDHHPPLDLESYRDSAYEKYASVIKQSVAPPSDSEVLRQHGVFEHYFGSLLPKDQLSRILEVGCGRGLLLRWLARKGYRNLTGIDLSAEQVQAARDNEYEVIHSDCLEFLSAPERLSRFDVIFAIDVLEHLKKDELLMFLRLARRCLSNEGRLIVQAPNGGSPLAGRIVYGDVTHETIFSPELFSRIVCLAGFRPGNVKECGPIPVGYGVKSSCRYVLWRACRGVLRALDVIEMGSSSRVYSRVFIGWADSLHDDET